MVENKQDWWNELEKKYDPEGVYRKKYQSEWNVKEVKQILFFYIITEYEIFELGMLSKHVLSV